jgi:hypothetical protein
LLRQSSAIADAEPCTSGETRRVNDAGDLTVQIGTVLRDGSVRYVVRPVDWRWVVGMGLASLVLAVVSLTSGMDWYGLVIWCALPLGVAWRSGFDVNAARGTIRGWNALGFVPLGSFTLTSLEPPQVRSRVESHTDNEGYEHSARVTRAWWGSRSLRVTLPKERLSELMSEAKRVMRAGRRSAKRT